MPGVYYSDGYSRCEILSNNKRIKPLYGPAGNCPRMFLGMLVGLPVIGHMKETSGRAWSFIHEFQLALIPFIFSSAVVVITINSTITADHHSPLL